MAKMYDFIETRNYQEEIDKAEAAKDYEMAAELERQRNAKIDAGYGNGYAKTYKYNTEPEAESTSGSSETSTPTHNSAKQSMGWASNLSDYSDSINDLYDSILNRDPFSYDYSKDPVYQQYAGQYTALGNRAMQDTLGQVSARTGGLASSYATGAAQGAYDAYMQQLAAKVPELYSLAYSMYQDEGDRQLQNLNMLRGLQSDERSQYNTDRAYNYGVSSDNWSRNFQARQYEDEKAQQELMNQRYGTEWGYGVGQDTKVDAQNRIASYLAAGGKVADLDPDLIAASGYTPSELAVFEKKDAKQARSVTSMNLSSDAGTTDAASAGGTAGWLSDTNVSLPNTHKQGINDFLKGFESREVKDLVLELDIYDKGFPFENESLRVNTITNKVRKAREGEKITDAQARTILAYYDIEV